jgi:FecR protein
MKSFSLLLLTLASLALPLRAAPLTESTFTEIINEVNTVSTAGDAAAAKVNDVLKAPQRVRTGPQSRAELTAPDKTITRVGANTVFSYADSGRTLNLEKGSLLFHSPKGMGGGTIKSGGAAAAVLGTTLMVSATADGGFKVILLEGTGKITLPDGNSVTLKAGQEVFVLPGGGFSQVFDINLDKLVQGSQLVKGFSHELSSLPLILAAIQNQNAVILSGNATDTGAAPEFFIPPSSPGNGLNALDPGSYHSACPPPLTLDQYRTLFGQGTLGNPTIGGTGGRGFGVTGAAF